MVQRWMLGAWCLLGAILAPVEALAQGSVCARVKIEIHQELTVERQAFDARMRINNGLPDTPLENVSVEVEFSDEAGLPVLATSDPNNTAASFFIRIDELDGIDAVDGTGTLAAGSEAVINWLIVPAPGSGGVVPEGQLYYVGATLRYDFGTDSETVEVSPDYIFVRPQPELELDYFLTREVFADDAFTPQIEPAEPFTLGVRVSNVGAGPAGNVRIESAQPRIVENEQGLLIDFKILGTRVNDEPATPSLAVSLGDLEPGASSVGRWIMETTLSGEFVEFSADYVHADELGGELTSLIAEVRTHQLVRDVLVDLPGRDAVRDFLAQDGDLYRLYESNGQDAAVADQSDAAVFGPVAGGHELVVPATAGPVFARVPDPFLGTVEATEVLRADGKVLREENVWFSKSRTGDREWQYWLNLFDHNTPGRYRLTLVDRTVAPSPLVMQFIPDRRVAVGQQIAFLVEASDPNRTLPVVTVDPLPAGAAFIDETDHALLRTMVFDWTPEPGQAGVYELTYTATDGALTTTQTALIEVYDTPDVETTMALEAGLNLISYPAVVPLALRSCETFLATLGDGAILERLNPQTQQVERCSALSGGFPLVPGEGYLVTLDAPATIEVIGNQPCTDIRIRRGVNLVGWPVVEPPISCFAVLEALGPEQVSALERYDRHRGQYEGCGFEASQDPALAVGEDFPVEPGEGYLLHVREAGRANMVECGP